MKKKKVEYDIKHMEEILKRCQEEKMCGAWRETQLGKCDQGMLRRPREKNRIQRKIKPKKERNCIKGCTVWGRREACIYQRRAPCKKPPGTETPVNSGNKKMIKSDLMSCRRQAKTHICHCETDAPAPPSHFSLPHSHSSSHSLIHYTLLSLMEFFVFLSRPIPSQTRLQKPSNHALLH